MNFYNQLAKEYIINNGMQHDNEETVTQNWFGEHCGKFDDETGDLMAAALCEELAKLN